MYTLAIGAGNCGKNIIFRTIREIFRSRKPIFSGRKFAQRLIDRGRFRGCYIFDLADIEIPRDIAYIGRTGRFSLQPVKIKTVIGAGVGGRWWEAEKEALKNIPSKLVMMESDLQGVENVMIMHSGGGGTGAGTGPVIAGEINKKYRAQIKWLSSIIVLPHEEEIMRKTNSLCTIGRYLGKSDSVIIIDNKRWEIMAEILKIPKEESNIVEIVNRVISRFYLWLNATDSVLKSDGLHEIIPKDYEAADYSTIARYPGKETSILAPFYAEYTLQELHKGYSLLFLLLKTLFKYTLVDVDFSQPIYNIFIIIGIPMKLKKHPKYRNIISEQLNSIDTHLNEILRVRNTISVIKIFYTGIGDRIVVTGFITQPYIPRLRDMFDEVTKFITKGTTPYSEDEIEHIERGLSLFEEISDYMTKYEE